MWLIDLMLWRCFFLADEVEPPPANPPDMVFMVSCSWGGSEWLMLVWVGGGLYDYYLVGGYYYGDRVRGCGC